MVENRIYALSNFVLPVPVSPRAFLYFLLLSSFMFLLSAVLPIFEGLSPMLRFGVLPFAATQFLLKKKLDGKAPHRYFAGWLRYALSQNEYIERFCAHPGGRNAHYRLDWQMTRGNWR